MRRAARRWPVTTRPQTSPSLTSVKLAADFARNGGTGPVGQCNGAPGQINSLVLPKRGVWGTAMDNFTFQIPTKIVFGRGTENEVGAEAAGYSSGSCCISAAAAIRPPDCSIGSKASLKAAGVEWVELGGVKPNPRLSLVHEGVRLCQRDKLSFVLAVGGGSAIDSAKAIAMGAVIDGDVWDFYLGKRRADAAAAGRHGADHPGRRQRGRALGTVITKEEGGLKRGGQLRTDLSAFSMLNPELAFTLPPFQLACGAVDIMAHLMERYFTNIRNVAFIDRLLEATMKTVIAEAPKVLARPTDYDAWSELMWAGAIAHNNLLNTGRVGDWGSHDIEHEICGIYDVAHGAGLAVVFPAWMKHVLAPRSGPFRPVGRQGVERRARHF